MKKTFLRMATIIATFAVAIASCTKENPNNGGAIKDPNENTGGQNQETPAHPSLGGSEYILLGVDEATAASLGNKVKANYFVDDVNMFLYIWENTYLPGTSSGLNFYGEAATWTSLVVGNVGWSGAGWLHKDGVPSFVSDAADMANWKFHIAYKGAENVAHIVIVTWNKQAYKFAIGDGSLDDNGQTYNAIAPKDGTFKANVWNEYEISLAEMGLDFTKNAAEDNIMSVLSGGTAGTTLDIDAMFFYK